MEDGILDNLPNVERDILEDSVIEQGALGSHLTHVRRRYETRSDEMVPDLRDVGQMLGLEIYSVARAIDPPLTLTFGQHSDDLMVVRVLA